MAETLRIGLPKGRVFKETCALFAEAGIHLGPIEEDSRQLVHASSIAGVGDVEVLVLRPKDVPAYVEHGVCAFGVAGYDTIVEQRPNVLLPVDLDFGRCRLTVAHLAGVDLWRIEKPRIATKYPRIATDFFLSRGSPAQIIELSGAIEIAPVVGLADAIVDLVETGETLRQNGLVEGERILDVSARLIINRAALRLHMSQIRRIQDALSAAVVARIARAQAQPLAQPHALQTKG